MIPACSNCYVLIYLALRFCLLSFLHQSVNVLERIIIFYLNFSCFRLGGSWFWFVAVSSHLPHSLHGSLFFWALAFSFTCMGFLQFFFISLAVRHVNTGFQMRLFGLSNREQFSSCVLQVMFVLTWTVKKHKPTKKTPKKPTGGKKSKKGRKRRHDMSLFPFVMIQQTYSCCLPLGPARMFHIFLRISLLLAS